MRVLQEGLTAATGVTVVGNIAFVLVERAKALAVRYRADDGGVPSALGGLDFSLPAESMPAIIQTTCVRGRTAAAAVLILALSVCAVPAFQDSVVYTEAQRARQPTAIAARRMRQSTSSSDRP